jgi:signal transduction histidine kinase
MFFFIFATQFFLNKKLAEKIKYKNLKMNIIIPIIPVLFIFFLFYLILFFSFYTISCFKSWLLIIIITTSGSIIYYQAILAKEKDKLYKKTKDYFKKLKRKVLKKEIKIKRIQENQKQMILNISHNLQSPLTILKAELEYMIKKEIKTENDSMKNRCKILEQSIDKLSDFIYGLLYLSKLETLKNEFKMKKINLSQLLESLCEYFHIMSSYKKIKLKKNIKPGIKIIGNDKKIEEMTTNLISNSIKYIGRGNFIKISLNLLDEKAVIKIEDNGIGIKKENLKKIFNKFFCSNKNGIKGSGLGLAIVKKIVDLHNGDIEVKSKEGEGTVFKISFKAEK